jgi:hypothetical protein
MTEENQVSEKIRKSFRRKIASGISKILNFIAPNLFFKIFFGLILIIPIAYILYHMAILPAKRFPENILNTTDIEMLPQLAEEERNDPQIDELLDRWRELSLQERYISSLIDIARSDSVNMSLNLRDSTLTLLIKGVPARPCKILKLDISSGIKHLKKMGLYTSWAGMSFTLQKEWSTIEKSPIKVKEAPKDTIEALKYMEEPALPPLQDVHVTLRFDRHLVLNISQVQQTTWKNYPKRLQYEWDQLKIYLKDAYHQLRFRQQAPTELRINLEISREDALAVYRAIPGKTELALLY